MIAEPEGIHSLGLFWKASFLTFTFTKVCCYRFFTAVFGIPLACLWGFIFAFLSLLHIWLVVPLVKVLFINAQMVAQIYGVLIRLFCMPCYEAAGEICHNIRVTVKKEEEVMT